MDNFELTAAAAMRLLDLAIVIGPQNSDEGPQQANKLSTLLIARQTPNQCRGVIGRCTFKNKKVRAVNSEQ